MMNEYQKQDLKLIQRVYCYCIGFFAASLLLAYFW